MSKGPGSPVTEFDDFLGNRLVVGDHVLIFQRRGDTEHCWSGQILEIHQVANKYSSSGLPVHYSARIQSTGAYSGWVGHHWPTEKNYQNEDEWKGELPRPTWILARKIVLAPSKVRRIPDGTRDGHLVVESYLR